MFPPYTAFRALLIVFPFIRKLGVKIRYAPNACLRAFVHLSILKNPQEKSFPQLTHRVCVTRRVALTIIDVLPHRKKGTLYPIPPSRCKADIRNGLMVLYQIKAEGSLFRKVNYGYDRIMMETQERRQCMVCKKVSPLISSFLGLCRACLQECFDRAFPLVQKIHKRARAEFGLSWPGEGDGSGCSWCFHRCGREGNSFCGLVKNGNRWAGDEERGLCEWYRDSLPTNCVVSWACPGRVERSKENLSVFYAGCTFDCLFCQNWHHHEKRKKGEPLITASSLAAQCNRQTFCVCFFGGDPSCQLLHALEAARSVEEKVLVCWETNGASRSDLIVAMYRVSAKSGGMLKFDLKALDPNIHLALTGVSNRQTLQNFALVARRNREEGKDVVAASTLLVPGYVPPGEVADIAHFIASLDPNIPYTLLAFTPNCFFHDLPSTTKRHASEALEACRRAGLQRVKVENVFILGADL